MITTTLDPIPLNDVTDNRESSVVASFPSQVGPEAPTWCKQ
jgi:hypothetical protein